MTAARPSPTLLASEAEFWSRVQEPSTRTRDESELVALADDACSRFGDRPLVVAAANVVLAYRSLDAASTTDSRRPALIEACRASLARLDWQAGFQSCRWWLSTRLALAAMLIVERRCDEAADVLTVPVPVVDEAFRQGQLLTNVVKCTLLRIVLAVDGEAGDRCGLERDVDRLLRDSRVVPVNYRFTNEFAYEEVAYVFSMLRQLFNWRTVDAAQIKDAAALSRLGVDWRIVGAPFKYILGTAA